MSELTTGGRGCENDCVGSGLCEGMVAKERSLEGRFSGVLGGSGGPGEVFRSIWAASVRGVDRGRGTSDAAPAMRC